jgi:hypothetical protein
MTNRTAMALPRPGRGIDRTGADWSISDTSGLPKNVMARLVRATYRRTVLEQLAQNSRWAMTSNGKAL